MQHDSMRPALADCQRHAFSRLQLDVRHNKLGPEGAKALAPALVRTSLTKILVGRNGLGDEGTTILCDALRESTVSKVEELDLQWNKIGPNGAKAITALCAVRGSLTSVHWPPAHEPMPCLPLRPHMQHEACTC